MSEPIELLFVVQTQMDLWNHVLDGSPDPPHGGALLEVSPG